MPELPEVETIRRDLTPRIVGRTIVEAWVSPNAPKLVQAVPAGRQGEPADVFCRRLAGRRIEELDRRGKYLLVRLGGGITWIVHLRMTGGLIHSRGGCEGLPDGRFLRARFGLDDGAALCYVDLRRLGTMWLTDDESAVVGKLGPEPLGEAFGPRELHRLLEKRRAPVKAVLLDQGAIAGVGNIYADEALFEAGIRPSKPARALSRRAAERLHWAVRKVLMEALEDRGSSFRDYVDAEGEQGMHQLRVKVFRRTGEPCYACGTAIKRVKVGGRSTHYCPKCQR
ncbi:MAG TPA: bifunctional DNA-formamidopyrimidine glycosylase/DNA-(apurinic or apyrimidinic site) lyase [Dehalococcoidia bacterium]|nr:bifunctional DNA-formamidopyrimidine glycosylase/DNA-(apurinic or apyrimidinic site) lyase [Dehalococcoidia bacterium]